MPKALPILLLMLAGISAAQAQFIVNTVAGGASEDGRPAASSHVYVNGAASCDDTVYLAAPSRIYAVKPDGLLRLIAGDGTAGVKGDGGPARNALMEGPFAMACDHKGNLYFSDTWRIRRIGPDGVISTVAGNGNAPGGPGSGSALYTPVLSSKLLAADDDGSVYFSSWDGLSVLKPDGTIAFFSGSSTNGVDDGDGGPATSAHSANIHQIAVDRQHNVYILSSNGIRKVTPDGLITTPFKNSQAPTEYVDGADVASVNLGVAINMIMSPSGDIIVTSSDYSYHRITADNKAFHLSGPKAPVACIDSRGNMYFGTSMLKSQTTDGKQTIFAGAGTNYYPDGTKATEAALSIVGIAADNEGRVLFSEIPTCRIRRINTKGELETLAGSGVCGGDDVDGMAPMAASIGASQLTVAPDGSIYFTSISTYRIDPGLNKIQKVSYEGGASIGVDANSNVILDELGSIRAILPQGVGVTIFGPPFNSFNISRAMAVDRLRSRVYAWDRSCYLWSAGPISGTGIPGFRQIGPSCPSSAAVSWDGTIWAYAGFISRWPSEQDLLQVSGTRANLGRCCPGNAVDGASATFAPIAPSQLAGGAGNTLYFLDASGRVIRKISGKPPTKAPVIAAGGVVNSASYSSNAFAPGQLITIFGDSLGYDTRVTTAENNQVGEGLGGTSVSFNGSTAPILSVTPGQINAIIPRSIRGSVPVLVKVDGIVSNTQVISVSSTAPALFTADATGKGPGAIINQDGSRNSQSNPAPTGSIVSFYGTGEGEMSPAPFDGALSVSLPFPLITAPVAVTIGNRSSTVQYAGAAPSLVNGVFQLNATIPEGTPPGQASVSLTIGGVAANPVTVWVK